ncbi:uncharacterized protein YPO0396 [Sphingomonas naasensis]|uniref:Uncharacterized protein n=1 Tax=Sphingomonas naasensis TaxID=1344951 RepID=A0A4S1WCW0_9SPHN|nr:hypothetical protein [Sphingomonas naasensis]NIJ22174.1 uncharacterized protein YPO0396 [Sphingomonas naasensis]TGX40804.1 hypothetical protein E5A74_15090 [Sphingomonas naasensis]
MSILSSLGGIATNPLSIAQLAMGPAGWASLAARTLMSAIGQQVIQQLGEKLGLPQSTIDMAQGAFCASMGDKAGVRQNLQEAIGGFAEAFNASPAEQGDATREMEDAVNKMVSGMADGEDAKAARAGGKGAKGTSGQSWLMALAEALGKKLDKQAAEMSKMADQITDKTPSLTAKFGAKSQEFGILMNATTNAIKTIGEGLANSARKG